MTACTFALADFFPPTSPLAGPATASAGPTLAAAA